MQFFHSISHNVLGWRRFCGCDKGMRSIPATVKMWWSKMPQRAESPTGILRNPSRPTGGEALTVCYAMSHPLI